MAALWSLTEIWPRKGRLNLKGVAMLTEINCKRNQGGGMGSTARVHDYQITSKYFCINKIILLSFTKNKLHTGYWVSELVVSDYKRCSSVPGGHSLVKQRAKNQIPMQVLVY